jgi:NitT/TauT family transport system substrate-binding protein
VKNAFKKKNISGVGTIAKSENQYQIIGRVDRGVVKETDLKGKKIGVPRVTVGEFYLGRFLELHGINRRDVNIIDVPAAQAVDAIGNGSVDAILIWKPLSDTIREQLGTNAVTWEAQSGQLGYWNAICKEDLAARNPELIKRFLKSMDEAAKYTVYHPSEARDIAQKWLHADKTYIDSAWPDTQFALSFDQSLITAMEDEGRWMINNNLTDDKNIPDYNDYLYLKGLEEVKPESVNIIR